MRQQVLDDTDRHRDRATVLCDKSGRPDRAVPRQPAVSRNIKPDEKIARKQRTSDHLQATGMPDRLLNVRKESYERLHIEIVFSLSFAIRTGMSEIPTA